MNVVWGDEALSDLQSIGEFIRRDGPRSAIRVVEHIRAKALLLEPSPRLGRPSTDGATYVLTLSRYPYVLVYEIEDQEVRILAVFHQSQNRP